MREEHEKGESRHHGRRYSGEEGARGPKTFRRRRAIAFLERMYLKRATIKQQLEQPEFQSIQAILVGELKAIDMVIHEFVQLFDINKDEMTDSKLFGDISEKGIELNEEN
ncbi:hypothetical protein HMPREF9372_1766 [Sporosarcina newyorkensis 2681]|uniref:Uncharacterized protein n=1 Tax=Sporosarcina newyorkensis 2681 TaxID=1027292 RepID=F9DSI6_9BACL|nr:hypothetical protein [Sporosarcina newyorkensis]EGQ26228.1 hypothetical protein HMPREF9372_1766 [Sporosarcina newyorkensis 2681]